MFGKLKEAKQMYSKYKTLQNTIKNLVIRSSYGNFIDPETKEERKDGVVIEVTGESVVKKVSINDLSLMENKDKLEENIKESLNKANTKLAEIIKEKTNETLGVNPEDFLNGLR